MKPKFRSLIAAFAPLSRSSLIVSAFASAGLLQSTEATPLAWQGATNDAWNTPSSWTPNQTPTTADSLTILGPAGVAGVLAINVNAAAAGDSISFTDTAAVTLTNTVSLADQTLTVQSGLTTGAGAVTIGSAVANQGVLIALGTSQIWNVGVGGLTATNVISGAGFAITKTGAGTLTLAGANTYSGGTTLTTGIVTAQDAATNNFVKALGTGLVTLNAGTLNLRANGSASSQTIITGDGTTGNNLTVGGNTTISVDRFGANTGSTFRLNNLSIGANTLTVNSANTYALQFAGTTTLTGNATFNNAANVTLTGAVGDGGSGFGITKQGAGTLTLASGANSYTGSTSVTAGVLVLNSLAGSGANVTVAAGATVAASSATDQTFLNRIVTTSAGALALAANTSNNLDLSAFGSLSFGATGAFDYTGTTLTPNGSTYRLGGGGGTLGISSANVVTGARNLVVTGNTSFKAAQDYSGSTTVNSGTLDLRGTGVGGGSILSSSGITVAQGAIMLLTNDATNGISTNRVADTTAITLNGGAFNFGASTAAATIFSETVGQLNLASGGQNRVITTNASGAGSSSTLTFSSLNRSVGTALSFSTNGGIGTAANKIVFTSAPPVDDGILIGGWADIGGADFAAYDASVGVKFPTYATTNSAETTWTQAQNLKLNSATAFTLTADRQVNSVNFQMTASTNIVLAGFTLRVESGGILSSGGSFNSSISGGNLTAGNGDNTPAELFAMISQGSTRPMTISANLVDNGTGAVSLVANGGVNNAGGIVIISGINTYTGTTTVAGGSLQAGSNTAVNNSKALTIATGATLLGAGTASGSTPYNVTVDGLFGGGTYNGGASNGGILSVGNGNGNGFYTGSFTPNGTTSRDFNIVKNGTGTQVFAGADFRDVTASGTASTTTINGGILQYAKQTSLYNNVTAKWTASKIIVNSGATLALNVGGTDEFTSANVDTIKALGTATCGFKSGSILALDTTNAGGYFTYASIIANTFAGANVIGLTKLGAGTLSLTAVNTYTGDTTVTAGKLAVNGSAIADTNKLVISGGQVEPTGTETVNTLYFGAAQQASGTWGATGSGAAHIDNTRFSGSAGVVSVTTGAPAGYAGWAATNAGGQDASADFDNDGVSNGAEYFMNAPAGFTANPALNGSNTITWTNGGNIPAGDYGTQFVVQTSSDLVNWTDVPAINLTTNTSGPGGSLVYTVTGAAPRFVRLKVKPN